MLFEINTYICVTKIKNYIYVQKKNRQKQKTKDFKRNKR